MIFQYFKLLKEKIEKFNYIITNKETNEKHIATRGAL
jgi:hypothetical protein